ncbi:GNAT family N-acetyltransferase [Hymenobacter sp. B81]|uniref:GNAT family N-acetyltransferase n=1 Tax=Hymenobacter sp. B81 TaxID=3344878 RepID=UPI0037DC327D
MPDKASYRTWCPSQPDLPVYVQPWYLDACCEGGEWDVALVREADRIVASLPYFWKQKGPFRYVTMPPFAKTMGPYLVPEYRGVLKKEHALLPELLAQLPKLAAFKQNFHPALTNWLPLYWQGYQQTTYYTYRIEGLQHLERVQADFNRNIRRNLQKARQQVTVRHDLSAEQFYQLNRMSFERQGLSVPYSWEQFRRHDAALAEHQARQFFFAVDDQGRIHSAAYLIWDQQAAYYHLSGDDPALRESGAGLLLIWEAIRYASEQLGLSCFDFEGSMLPAVERIRVQFGAKQTPYFYVWKYHSRWFKLLEQLKR